MSSGEHIYISLLEPIQFIQGDTFGSIYNQEKGKEKETKRKTGS